MQKMRDSATNCVWLILWVLAFDSGIDIPRDGVHDGVWYSPFALVLATDLLPKRQWPYQILSVGLTDRLGVEWASEALGDAHKSAALGV
jgi:hypothetical protein